MAVLKKLPMGIESFEKIRRDDFYYVDKTGLIKVLLENWGEANLFTRPRRFGKSLNMSMLQSFFEIGCERKLFDGLAISEEAELCEEYMGKFPVISISLKGIEAETYEEARDMLASVIREEARRLQFLLESTKLTEVDKEFFSLLLKEDMSDQSLRGSLRELSLLLCRHFDKRVIILIDEYDVPLAKANERGYYDRMVLLVRNLFEAALKTNDNLYFSVLTGCLRVAKESIFTGLNNFNVFSITDMDFDEYFGFTDEEVKEILAYYGLEENYEIVKDWYDGYRFGNSQVYCPWDVICYCSIGVPVRAFSTALVLLSSLLSACVTAFAGPISFVGIAVPHLVKNLLGSAKPLYVLPGCCLGGAAFCLLCDLIARSLFAPTELSISSVTAVFGAPVVIWLLVHRQTQEGRE